MLDQVIAFADSVESDHVTVSVHKDKGEILVRAVDCPGIIFNIDSLRSSNGGIVNDITALKAINSQLAQKPKGK